MEAGDDTMLQKQTRELMVKAYHNSRNMREVARNFSVNVSTVWRYVQKEKAGESLAPQTYKRGRKAILTGEQRQEIEQLVSEQPDITICEICKKLNLPVSEETVRKTVIGLGFVYKKKSLHAYERERTRCGKEA